MDSGNILLHDGHQAIAWTNGDKAYHLMVNYGISNTLVMEIP